MLKTNLFFVTIFALLFLLSSSNVHSQTVDLKLSAEGHKAFETLLVANQFEDTELGYAAKPSKLVEAYNVLLNESMADAAFKQLLEKATLPGQLYALCGLWFTDNSFFRSAIENYRYSDKFVSMQSGCIGRATSVSALVEDKNPVIIDSSRPKESLNAYFDTDSKVYTEWSNRKKKKKTDKPPEGHGIDIFNGGYSVWFRDRKFLK